MFSKICIAQFKSNSGYQINYIQTNESFPVDSLPYTSGHTETLIFKEGNYIKKIFTKDNLLIREYYFNIDSLKSYYKTIGEDTILWQDKTINDTKGRYTKVKDSLILGHPVQKVLCNLEVKNIFGEYMSIVDYGYYSKELKLNPELYKNYREADYNKLVELAPGIVLMQRSNHVVWNTNKVAIDIKIREVKDSELEFKYPLNSVFKEFK